MAESENASDLPVSAAEPGAGVDDPAARLERVVDDLEPRLRALDWIRAELLRAVTPEDITLELLANGWSEAEAAELVESVRRETRSQRGIVTREEIVRGLNQRYSRGMAGWMAALPTPAAAMRLIFSVMNLRALRPRAKGVRGRCAVCGYDLRATPDRCPECGTIPRG